MMLEDATYEAFGYYPSALKPQSDKHIVSICTFCGRFRVGKKRNYHFFCKSCSHVLGEMQKGKKHPMFNKHHSKAARVKISKNHTDVSGEKNPSWKGGTVECSCIQCGKTFSVSRGHFNAGGGKYCTISCAVMAQRHNAKPPMTGPEISFQDICSDNNLPFRFVGDGALYLGHANPDFVHDTKKIVIEVNGDYWHSPLLNRNLRYASTVEGRRKQLKAEGYKCIILWESDLKRSDAEAFVMHLMQKEGII